MCFTEEVRRGPTPGLNLHLTEDSPEITQPTAEDIRCRNILKNHCGERAKLKCAQRKFNYIGLVVGHLAFVNSPENTKRMHADLRHTTACNKVAQKLSLF